MQIVYKDGSEFKLEYDDEKHSYVVDGNKIPSVTKVIDSCSRNTWWIGRFRKVLASFSNQSSLTGELIRLRSSSLLKLSIISTKGY